MRLMREAASVNPLFKVPVLTARLWFPDPGKALAAGHATGLLAIGGDLSTDRLLLAYRSGIFPWSVHPVSWWSPDPRAIFELGKFHLSRSLAKFLRKGEFRASINQAFRQVIQLCAEPSPDRPESWISPEFVHAYTALHQAGYAHSVECWLDNRLVGGVYGVGLGGLFAAESMFHRADNASKVALYFLMQHLQARGFALVDIQVISEHTRSLGAITIPRAEYLQRLKLAVDLPCKFS